MCNGGDCSSGGSIFILGINIINNGKIESTCNESTDKLNEKYYGEICIYSSLFVNNGTIIPSKYYLNKYNIGLNINSNRINNLKIKNIYGLSKIIIINIQYY